MALNELWVDRSWTDLEVINQEFRNAIFIIGLRRNISDFLDFRNRVTHGDANTSVVKHILIVFFIAKCG